MPFDAPVVACLAKEIMPLLPLKIDKIYQPYKDEFVITCYGSGESHKLLLSLNSQHARFHLFQGDRNNPSQPSSFCMLLRKYFGGSKLIRIEAVPFERILKLTFEVYDPVEGLSKKYIWLELTGKSANLIVGNEHEEIIDSWRRQQSGERDLSNGTRYQLPPTGGRFQPVTLKIDQFSALIENLPAEVTIEQFFSKQWIGLSGLAINEIASNAGLAKGEHGKGLNTGQITGLYRSFEAWTEHITCEAFKPTALYDQEGNLLDYWAFPITNQSLGSISKPVDSLNTVIAQYLNTKHEINRFQENKQNLLRQIRQHLDKNLNKLKKQQTEAQDAKENDQWRIMGELLKVYGYQITRGSKEANLPNHYDPEGNNLVIPLNPALSALENAQAYFKKYQKAKKGQHSIAEQIQKTAEAIDYLESLETLILTAGSIGDLVLVRDEFQETLGKKKDIPARGKNGKNGSIKKELPSKPRQFELPSGHSILIGRNNIQNDKLTFKTAAPTDWWFHTQKIPGSHVILKPAPGTEVDSESLNFACQLAVFYSKARESTKVPVDYTQRKNVKKPPASKPGFVIYDFFKTAIITPDLELLKQFKIDRID